MKLFIKELATGQANLPSAPDTEWELALIRHYDNLREVSIYPCKGNMTIQGTAPH